MLKLLKYFYLLLTFSFIYLPILIIMIFSFNSGQSAFHWDSFSLKWYYKLFANAALKDAIYNTFLIAFLSSLISIIIGLIGAYGIFKLKNKKIKFTLLAINKIPIINPDIVTGISLMSFFIFLRFSLNFNTLLISHIIFSTPYVILSILPKLYSLPENIVEASMDLGANERETFFYVILPELIPGIILGGLLAFTLSVDDFIISFFTTGAGVSNISIFVHSLTKKGISPEINALSTLMFIVILSLLFIISKFIGIKNITDKI